MATVCMETKVLLETSKVSHFSEKYTEKSDIQFKKVPVQTLDPQTSDGTNLRLTNVGQYKCRTRTNVRQYKRRTSTNVRPVQTSDKGKQIFEF